MIRRPPRSTLSSSSAASDVYKRQGPGPAAPGRGHRDARVAAGGRPARPAPDRLGQRAGPRPPDADVLPDRAVRRRAAGPGERAGAAPAGGVLGARGVARPADDVPAAGLAPAGVPRASVGVDRVGAVAALGVAQVDPGPDHRAWPGDRT